MGRRRKGRIIHGVLLLDKPPGISSNQAVQRVRGLFGARKAGHTGSLDPFATGMLPVCLGEATKTAGFMLDSGKTYVALAHLGQKTDTGDTEGTVVHEQPVPDLDRAAIDLACARFTGPIEQVPPMYSALKHEGKRLYQLAREGKSVERVPRQVTIHSLRVRCWQSPELEFEVHCSKGTYVRTLAEDLADLLGTCAHLTALRRTAIDVFSGCDLVSMELLERAAAAGEERDLLLPIDAGLGDWQSVALNAAQVAPVRHGNSVTTELPANKTVVIRDPTGAPVALGEIDAAGMLLPKRVFVFDEEPQGPETAVD